MLGSSDAPPRGTVLLRGTLLLVACGTVSVPAWVLARDPLRALALPLVKHGPAVIPSLTFTDVVAGCCAAALLGCAGWVLATTVFVVLTHLARLVLPGSPVLERLSGLVERGCPALARGVIATTLGLTIGTAVAAPALADPSGGGAGHASSSELTGLGLPDRTTGTEHPAGVVVVRRGDSLWSIASDLLSAGADDGTVTRAWHRLYRANLSRVGEDPDLIQPGTRLVVPHLLAPHRKELP